MNQTVSHALKESVKDSTAPPKVGEPFRRTTYLYCVFNRYGDYYIGVHAWDGNGIDQSYQTSSSLVQSLIKKSPQDWTFEIIDLVETIGLRNYRVARSRMEHTEALLIKEHIREKRCLNRGFKNAKASYMETLLDYRERLQA